MDPEIKALTFDPELDECEELGPKEADHKLSPQVRKQLDALYSKIDELRRKTPKGKYLDL